MPSEPILVSACLLGQACRYDGACAKEQSRADLARILAKIPGAEPIAFCPEDSGGLATPRPPAWIESKDAAAVLAGEARLVTQSGADVTAAFKRGAANALAFAQSRGIKRALLKERSPSCGVAQTHIAGKLANSPGVTAQLLLDHGIDCEGI